MYVLDPIEPSGIVKSCIESHASQFVLKWKAGNDDLRAHFFGTGFDAPTVCASHGDLGTVPVAVSIN